jgi:hypothetical protein
MGSIRDVPKIGKRIFQDYIALAFLREYVFYEMQNSFEVNSEKVSYYLEETASLLSNPSMLDDRWIGRLKEEKIIDSAYFTSNDQVSIVGAPMTPDLMQKSGYIIDEMGKVHYVYNDEKSAVFLDAVIDQTGLQESFSQDRYIPRTIIIYDMGEETFTDLNGGSPQLIENIDEVVVILENNSFLISKQGITMSRIISVQDSTLMLISQYPVKLGRRAYNMFGLIAVVILTIILAVGIIRYSVYGFEQISGGLFIMADKKDKGDVISEIDKEISDIIDGEEAPLKTPAKLPDTPTEKFAQKKSEDSEVEQRKKLEADGIIIKKG